MHERTRLVPAQRRDDAGLTLVELLVTMMVFSIAIAITFQALITVQRVSRDVALSADAVSELRLALATIDRQVRSGNVLYSPADEPAQLSSCTADATSGTCMRVLTQVNGDERCVQWQVLPGDAVAQEPATLRRRSWTTDWQTSRAVSGWSTVARGLLLDPDGPMPFTLQGGSTPYQSRLLDVRLEALDPRAPGSTVVIESSLSGRNTNYGYDAGLCSPVPPG